MKYFLIKVKAKSFLDCVVGPENMVLSEPPATWLGRQNQGRWDARVTLEWFEVISKDQYAALHKANPTNEGYFHMAKRDYAKWVPDEEYEEEYGEE